MYSKTYVPVTRIKKLSSCGTTLGGIVVRLFKHSSNKAATWKSSIFPNMRPRRILRNMFGNVDVPRRHTIVSSTTLIPQQMILSRFSTQQHFLTPYLE